MNILYIIAMQAEAQPFIEHYGVQEVKDFFAPLPCKLYRTEIVGSDGNTSQLNVVLNGRQHDSDLVGCEAASVATLLSLSVRISDFTCLSSCLARLICCSLCRLASSMCCSSVFCFSMMKSFRSRCSFRDSALD